MYSSQPTVTPQIHAEFTSVSTTVEDQDLLNNTMVSFNMPLQTISSLFILSLFVGIQVKMCLPQTQKPTSPTRVYIHNSSRTSCAASLTYQTTAVKQETMSARVVQLRSHLSHLLLSPLFGLPSDIPNWHQFFSSKHSQIL